MHLSQILRLKKNRPLFAKNKYLVTTTCIGSFVDFAYNYKTFILHTPNWGSLLQCCCYFKTCSLIQPIYNKYIVDYCCWPQSIVYALCGYVPSVWFFERIIQCIVMHINTICGTYELYMHCWINKEWLKYNE